MSSQIDAKTFLNREAAALRTRVDRLVPFSLTMTMAPAANISNEALAAIEAHMKTSRRRLRQAIEQFRGWLSSPAGDTASAAEAQRRFMILKLLFNSILSHFDVFADVLVQRSESGTGVWISGLDDMAADAMRVQGASIDPPPVVCYLDRGHGAAIRRARARLPGGGINPVAVIRVPRERMVGQGIGASLVHEVGHQTAALLDLVNPLRLAFQKKQRTADLARRAAWICWERWVSEIVADLWAVGKLGPTATFGLMGVVSLPKAFVFHIDLNDPHPFPWIRVMASLSIGQALHPHPQWSRIARMWEAMYPVQRLPASTVALISILRATLAELSHELLNHQPQILGGRTLGDALRADQRSPDQVAATWRRFQKQTDQLHTLPPTLAMAAIGQARTSGQISPGTESKLISKLLLEWAVKSSLDSAYQSVRCRRNVVAPVNRVPFVAAGPDRAAIGFLSQSRVTL
ncbi:MAG TPA: hypothetical protein PKD54_07745 [Pirellulaceae bacterium]|nr:hypothetical protein [Pirellulaceae bacterium]